jgi:hypothetical protein
MKKTGGEPAIEERWTIPVSSSCSDAQHPQLNLNKKVNLFRGERKYIFYALSFPPLFISFRGTDPVTFHIIIPLYPNTIPDFLLGYYRRRG